MDSSRHPPPPPPISLSPHSHDSEEESLLPARGGLASFVPAGTLRPHGPRPHCQMSLANLTKMGLTHPANEQLAARSWGTFTPSPSGLLQGQRHGHGRLPGPPPFPACGQPF